VPAMSKRRACGFSITCWVLVSVLGLTSSTQTTTDLEETEAEWAQRNALLEQLRASSATAEQLQKLLELAAGATQTSSHGMAPDILIDTNEMLASQDVKDKSLVAAKLRQLSGSNSSTTLERSPIVANNVKTIMLVIAAVILLYQTLHFLIHFGIIPKPGFKTYGTSTVMEQMTECSEQEIFHSASAHHLSTKMLIKGSEKSKKIKTGKVDQAWCEQLGLCETEAGEKRWFEKSEIDPAESHSQHAASYEIEDTCAWPGDNRASGQLDVDKSDEEKCVVNLQHNCLERERYVTVLFKSLFRRQIWSDEPGSYPGPAFQTKEEFTKGCQPGRWPLGLRVQPEGEGELEDELDEEQELTEQEDEGDVDLSELTSVELVRELRNFIWRNNAAGSWKATFIMVFLGSATFPSIYIFSKIVEVVTAKSEEFTFFAIPVPLSALPFLLLLISFNLVVDLVCSYLSYKFWTVVPKYGVLRQFQSFFGRQCMKILMTQAGSKSKTLKSAHEDRFRSSPGLCQAMTNYCCEGVVLSLWGKGFDWTRAVATLVTSVLLILYSFASLGPKDENSFTFQRIWHNILDYGGYLLLFTLVNFSMFLMNVLSRFKESEDMWGVATKTKLNTLSLQQELTVRMMRSGKNRKGAGLTAEDQQVLDEACSEWHDACRIYGNRDFHTWFASWIITENSGTMINGITLAMVMVVLGSDAYSEHIDVGAFVLLVGAVRSMNTALASVLAYYFSLPEGYICLLYLAQVCNLT